ncbi:LysR family transcriptional regulator [Variovorax sp. OV329]|uniref:LysR family transcriptional regulator n=1 Tax=Variovorax sp. OV329 TaxID=1882825 RepID=UPI0008F14D0C|nr:LysR family transcriptional regulator [Variovorax sp. OV329]SFL87819.1 DNA-binding transcriptional regulator, LysR family [Variovorax sp. OV329]
MNRLVVFVAVVEAGSLSAAARRLGLAKTMVSAHMQRLEAEVGASLLLRSTRHQSLTDAGEAFYEASRRIVQEAQEAISAAGQDSAEPRGTLRIAAPNDYAATVVAPVAVALRRRHPGLGVELVAGDRVVDMLKEGIDVAIRAGRLADSSLLATRIGSFSEWLVASPQRFEAGDVPARPQDVTGLPFIALSVLTQPLNWTFTSASGRSRRTLRFEQAMSCNTSHAVRSAALAGGGLAVLPDYAVKTEVAAGRLLKLLPGWSLPESGIYAVFPAARHRARKVHAFLDALREHIERTGVLPDF